MSATYIDDLKKRLARFCVDFGERKIEGITVEEPDDWLRALHGSPKSRANYQANVGVLFSYAERRRMLDSNPILHTARPKYQTIRLKSSQSMTSQLYSMRLPRECRTWSRCWQSLRSLEYVTPRLNGLIGQK